MIELFGAPIYVRHEVVHDRFGVDGLRGVGAEEIVGREENVVFALPGELRAKPRQ